MAIPAGKTPISYLQELCTKRGITPQYDLMANEGAVHEPIFIMSVSVGDIVSTGKGQYYTFISLTTEKYTNLFTQGKSCFPRAVSQWQL